MGPLIEFMQIAGCIVPVNLATAANAGDWVSMADFDRIAIVIFKGVGTAGEDPTITLQQATDASGTGAKALNFVRVDVKQGALLTAIGEFTTTIQTAANTYTNATLAETQAIIVIDVMASDLDVNNSFKFIQASIADVGTDSQIGCGLYLAYGCRYQSKTLPSVLA